MNKEMAQKFSSAPGFIAALDQSGGSTPKALKLYGIEESAYSNDEEMFDLVHAMRARIITDPAPGAVARQGERFGLIRFGSRVDLFLPPDARLRVRVGDRMKAGASVVADLPAA